MTADYPRPAGAERGQALVSRTTAILATIFGSAGAAVGATPGGRPLHALWPDRPFGTHAR